MEIHVHDPVADRALFWDLLGRAPVKAVTVGLVRGRPADDPALGDTLDDIRAKLSESRTSTLARTAHEPRACAPAALADEPRFVIAPQIAITLRDGGIKVTGGSTNIGIDIEPEILRVLRCFVPPAPVSALLDADDAETGGDPSWLAAVVRDLLALGVIVKADAACGAHGAALWTKWDSALDFYLATRTTHTTRFASAEETNEKLVAKVGVSPAPAAFKDYPVHPFYPLPDPLRDDRQRVDERAYLDVLLRRRSMRSFSPEPVTGAELSQILYYVWGVVAAYPNPIGDPFIRRTSPGGGSLHGTEVYPILRNVEGLHSGVYHYSVRRHGLELLSREDPGEWIGDACGGQEWVADAAAVFIMTNKIERLAWKYEFSRALRVAFLDAGHLGQSFALTSTWLGLAPFTVGAVHDAMLEEKLGLDYLTEPIMLATGVGRPAKVLLIPDRPNMGPA
ncbi:SagB/ThcOx family dehydrogenase [Sphingomonas ginsenosidivorax]|uniref:SagB/ThcOx family dehydrogenase n=1 Tax=Sphingomonas ginsenosidivorax TaxID=862135 RepID=UPI0013155810|nr:SagB/ThcOx family dehydrogenase [Sphingomonas ginsenosidivorax]